MKSKRSICLTLFSSMFRISAFTFGGGFVIIPLMRRRFIDHLGWLTEEEVMDMSAIAQSSPGAVSLNIGAQLGWHMAGPWGALSAVAGTLIPPIFWLALISHFYDAVRASPIVDAFLSGMQPAVTAVILSAGCSMFKKLKNKDRASTWIMFGAALVLSFAGVKAVYLLMIGAVFGALIALREVHRHVS